MSVRVRQARPGDALGALIYQASPILYDRYFGGRARALCELGRVFARPGHSTSYEVSAVAVPGGTPVGVIVGYPSAQGDRLTRRFFTLTLARMAPWRWPSALGFLRALGAADLEPPAGSWYVDALAVDSSHRRGGAARALLTHAEARARGLGCSWLALDTDLGNSAARSLYESFGMREGAVWRTDDRLRATGGGWIAYVKAL